ncbi:hypothetical protein G6F22_018617 [Rhizopus arrhizus]|nr:hypothetical protein G6F22_018617 [Rhizopus arrhizus]
MELDAVAQLERIGLAVRADVNRLGQQRAHFGVFAIGNQAFHDVQHDGVAIAVAVDAGFGRADVGRQRNAQRRRRLCGGRAGQGGQRQRNRGAQTMVLH